MLSKALQHRLWACTIIMTGAAIGLTGCTGGGDDDPTTHVLTLRMTGSGSLLLVTTSDSTPGGTYNATDLPDTVTFTEDTVIQLTATPATGWSFAHWSDGASGTANPLTTTVDHDMTLTAVFEENGEPQPGVFDDTNIDEDTVIPAGTYLVDDDIYVSSGATLTLQPGVTIRMGRARRIVIEDDGVAEFVGSASNPIVITGEDATPGYWYGLLFDGSNSTGNILEYVTVEYGGEEDNETTGNVMLQGDSRLVMNHCTLQNGAAMGLAAQNGAAGARLTFADNFLKDNALGAATLHVRQIAALDSASSFDGNDIDRILVYYQQTVEDDMTWPNVGVPYELESSLYIDAHLTIAAGVQMEFHDDLILDVNDGGALTAVGTVAVPIVFTATDPTPGYWLGINFGGSNSVSNVMQHFVVEYAGQGTAWSQGGIAIWDGARVQIDHGTVRYSEGAAIWIRGATYNADIATANTFSDNAGEDVHIQD